MLIICGLSVYIYVDQSVPDLVYAYLCGYFSMYFLAYSCGFICGGKHTCTHKWQDKM